MKTPTILSLRRKVIKNRINLKRDDYLDGKMIFELMKTEDKFLENELKKSIKEFDKFFKLKWKKNKPIIIKIPDRKTIDALWSKETEPWVVGWTSNNQIFILDKKNYESESNHKYSNEEYISLIKHELSHLYIGVIIEKGFIPKWLNEGICIYVSGQNKFKKKPKFFNEFLNFSKNIKKEIYRESGFIVEYLLKEYGHEKIIKLLNESKKIKDEKDFKDKFEEIYKVPLGYPTFNQN